MELRWRTSILSQKKKATAIWQSKIPGTVTKITCDIRWPLWLFQESYNTPLEHTPGNPPTQLWKEFLFCLLVKVWGCVPKVCWNKLLISFQDDFSGNSAIAHLPQGRISSFLASSRVGGWQFTGCSLIGMPFASKRCNIPMGRVTRWCIEFKHFFGMIWLDSYQGETLPCIGLNQINIHATDHPKWMLWRRMFFVYT